MKSEGTTRSSPTTSRDLPRIVSLFSGAGGLDLGFEQAGFDVAVAFEFDEAAVKSHRANFPSTVSHCIDLESTSLEAIAAKVLETVPEKSRIGIIGGPPCQGFSRANIGASAMDPRNRLTLRLIEIAIHLQKHFDVSMLAFENVAGILESRNDSVYLQIKRSMDATGLAWRVDRHDAVDFGVPQRRRRVIFVALHSADEVRDLAPSPCESGRRTVREAIEGLGAPTYFEPNLDSSKFAEHPNHWTMQPRSPKFSGNGAQANGSGRSFRKLAWDQPSPTVAYGHREIHVHPDGHRRLSIFEAMRLQGFPDTFELQGNLSQQVQQISNAVPPPLSRAVAEAVAVAIASRDD